MYPMKTMYAELFAYEKDNGDYVYGITDQKGHAYALSRTIFAELLMADGLHELRIKPASSNRLIEAGLLTRGHLEFHGLWQYVILWPVGKRGKKLKKLAEIFCNLLPLFALAAMALGIYRYSQHQTIYTSGRLHVLTFYGVILLSFFLHELGHLVAAMANERIIRHFGCVLLGIIPVGFYIHYGDHDQALLMRLAEEKVKERTLKEKAQLAFSGCGMNLLAAGLCLMIQSFYLTVPDVVQFVIVFNVLLAVVNFLPCFSFDGAEFLSLMFNKEHLDQDTLKTLFNKKRRQSLLQKGSEGSRLMGAFVVMLMARIVLLAYCGYALMLAFIRLFA